MSTRYKPTNLYRAEPAVGTIKAIVSGTIDSFQRLFQTKKPLLTGLAILAILMATVGISLAKTANYKGQNPASRGGSFTSRSRSFAPPIKNPYDTKSYMFRLSERLSPEARRILLFGFEERRTGSAKRPKKALSAPRQPTAPRRSRVSAVQQVPERTAIKPTKTTPMANHVKTPIAPTRAEGIENLIKSLEEVLSRADKLTDLEKPTAPVVEQVPKETAPLEEDLERAEKPKEASPTPGHVKTYLIYSPTKEKEDLIESPKKALSGADKPTALEIPRAPIVEQTPKQTIQKPAKALSGIGKPSASEMPRTPIADQTPSQTIETPKKPLLAPGKPIDLEKPIIFSEQRPTYSAQHFETAWHHAGLVVDDVVNVFTIGHGSDRAAQLRANDGKNPSFHLVKVKNEGGQTINSILNFFYSTGDAVLADSLPNLKGETYRDNYALLRPCVFSVKAIGSAWKTVENVGNTLTWGYFDNVTGSAAMCIWDIIKSLKHSCQAVVGLGRGPIDSTVNKTDDKDEPAELSSNR